MIIKAILEKACDVTLAQYILESFRELEANFYKKSWKTSELDAGHFVESVRRLLEFKLYQKYTPIGKSLPPFNENLLQTYGNAIGDESYRIHIPRALLTIYGVRNKRGVGHISVIKPNKIDATLILSISKWVLAEIIRLNSIYSLDQTEALIDEIIERNIEGIWETAGIRRILIDNLKLNQQVLVLLFNFSELKDTEIYEVIENGNFNYLKKTLRDLHSKRLIEYKVDGTCVLSPKGAPVAEKLILGQ